MLKEYELLYIIPNKFTDEEIKPITEKINGLIKSAGGTISREEVLGKKKLAFPIKQFYHGYYILNYFNAEPKALNKLNKDLKLTDEVLRHIIVNKVTITPITIPQPGEREEAKPTKAPEEKISEIEIEKKERADKKKVSIEELDKKLDEILDSTDII